MCILQYAEPNLLWVPILEWHNRKYVESAGHRVVRREVEVAWGLSSRASARYGGQRTGRGRN
jgi:hypothetical protein